MNRVVVVKVNACHPTYIMKKIVTPNMNHPPKVIVVRCSRNMRL